MLASNIVFPYLHRQPELDDTTWGFEADPILAEVRDGTRSWTASLITVDGAPAEFEILDYGHGVWAAVGQVGHVDVTFTAIGVQRQGVALASFRPQPTDQ